MATKKLTPAQAKKAAAKQKQGLKKLRELGLVSAKTDLRKKPGRSQLAALKKFNALLTGKARAIKVGNAKDYKDMYTVKGDTVIIPKRKGETIRVNKKGEVTTTRRVNGVRIKSTYQKTDASDAVPTKSREGYQYAIPFHARGSDEPDWHRFPTYAMLKKFMARYNYKGWQKFVVEEKIGERRATPDLKAVLEGRGVRMTQKKTRKPRKRKAVKKSRR